MKNTQRSPQVGEHYWSGFESDYDDRFDDPGHVVVLENLTPETMTIVEVGIQYEDGVGWEITASDGVGYDCYWSEKLKFWVYSLQ